MTREDDTIRFYELVWPHRATILRTARYLMRRDADAEDLAQETMVKAFRAIATLRDDHNVKPWLFSILRTTRIDHLRAEPPPGVSLDQLQWEPASGEPQGQAERVDAWADPDELLNAFSDRDIIRALREVPREIRWTLLLVDVEGLDQNEASSVLGVPVGTVKSRLHRGRFMLRQRLQDCRPAVRRREAVPA